MPELESFDDGAFVIHETRFGTYRAVDRNGNGLCSGNIRDDVIFWAREHLNGYQNSWASTTKTSFNDGYKL